MYVSHLGLTNFRNFRQLELDLPPGSLILHGANAQGKTSILEAIYLLAISRSFCAENERELVNWEAAAAREQALVSGTVEGADGRTKIYIGFQCIPAPELSSESSQRVAFLVRKEIRVGGVRRTAAELVGTLNAVLFSAADIDLVTGSPSQRRRYLDILISQADGTYLRTLQRYQRVLYQRNQLLKLVQERRAKGEEMEFWDRQLVVEGSKILWQRAQALDNLSSTARQIHLELTAGREALRMEYQPSVALASSPEQVEREFTQALSASRPKEARQLSTLVGPHRDDFQLLVNGVDMGTFASRGQARTLALTLRLAEASYLAQFRGQPVVLLDDVLSELDVLRRQQVLERVMEYQQTIITTTDTVLFPAGFLAHALFFEVREGKVERAGSTGA